jgi:hypothetical protein
MNDSNRATTLRLRTPLSAPSTNAAPPRSFAGGGQRTSFEGRRPPLQTFIPNRPDPTSRAILDELAALGLVEPEERD